MREALYNLVGVWRDPANPPADQRAINHAPATEAWEESATQYLALVRQVVQTFGDVWLRPRRRLRNVPAPRACLGGSGSSSPGIGCSTRLALMSSTLQRAFCRTAITLRVDRHWASAGSAGSGEVLIAS